MNEMSVAPLVSVLMPVYNAEKYLAKAIKSILNQTFQDFEFIIVDDGSSDATANILADYQRKDSRIQLYQQENQGIAVTLNKGLDLSQGKYIVRMDADDISHPKRIEKQVAFMEAHTEVGVCGTLLKTFGSGISTIWRYPTDDASLRCHLLFTPAIAHPSVIMRRSLFSQIGLRYNSGFPYTEDYYPEDYALWIQIARYMQMANLPEILIYYRQHPNQVVKKYRHSKVASAKRIRYAQLEHLGIHPSSEEVVLHEMVSLSLPAKDLALLKAVEVWLRKMVAVNEVTGIYDEQALVTTLGKKWYYFCSHSSHLGMDCWYKFWQSLFGQAANLRQEQILKLFVKCMIKWGN